MGVAGATLTGHAVLIAGLAGLLAGAFSMSIGEWVSVQSARELNQHQIAIERQELQEAPKEEQEELALIYQSKGLDEHTARELAANLMQQGTTALDTLAREELGIDPKDLGGSAWEPPSLRFSCSLSGLSSRCFRSSLPMDSSLSASVSRSACWVYSASAQV